MTNVIKPDFEFESKLKHAIFGVHWNSLDKFRIYVKAAGKNTIPPWVKKANNGWEGAGGFVPLDFGKNLPKPMAIHFDVIEIFVLGMTFGGTPYDVRIPWDEVGAIGREPGPYIAFSSRVEDAHAQPAPEGGAEVISLAERRKKPPA